jgi:hypothetical protein
VQFNTREHVLGPFLVLVELAQRQRDPVEAEREHPRLRGTRRALLGITWRLQHLRRTGSKAVLVALDYSCPALRGRGTVFCQVPVTTNKMNP